MKASFSLEAVSDAAYRYGAPPAWYMTARGALGRRGQFLNWIGAKRYEALRRRRLVSGLADRTCQQLEPAVKRSRHYKRICCAAPHIPARITPADADADADAG
jgi:hypothetical protein